MLDLLITGLCCRGGAPTILGQPTCTQHTQQAELKAALFAVAPFLRSSSDSYVVHPRLIAAPHGCLLDDSSNHAGLDDSSKHAGSKANGALSASKHSPAKQDRYSC